MSEVGTLKELGVKPGDVVSFTNDEGDVFIYEIHGWKDGKCYSTDNVFGGSRSLSTRSIWTIISRANTTVNYNDGLWHGWNGGECPVHPETEIEYLWNGSSGVHHEKNIKAKHCIEAFKAVNKYYMIAFHVIKEYKDPREITIDGVTYREVIE